MKILKIIGMLFLLLIVSCATPPKYPDGAIWKEEKVLRQKAPAGFTMAVAWAQVATTTEQGGEGGLVFVDYLRLIEIDEQGNEKIIAEENYEESNSPSLDKKKGGLYCRQPNWFADDKHQPINNSCLENGCLVLKADETPDKILHWWTARAEVKNGSRHVVEVRFKLQGKICLQLGLDYWRDKKADWNGWHKECVGTNNCEGFIGGWYCSSSYGFTTVRAPAEK
ncbi:MAG: hypothetical protein WC349_01225 [Patescibacteria group bacterium]|jgi:hypothetical protein